MDFIEFYGPWKMINGPQKKYFQGPAGLGSLEAGLKCLTAHSRLYIYVIILIQNYAGIIIVHVE